ncbi:MAG TPA: hypothetical protein VKX49_11000 [Bryobacteraceae bacterium]|nr:hypothetical protein [Bryobacteraceae bacterium]
MAKNKSNKKVANGLVAMSSAAVLAVYAAGYVRTRPAASRLDAQVYERPLAPEVPAKRAAADAGMPPAAPNRPAVAPVHVLPAHEEVKHPPASAQAATPGRPQETIAEQANTRKAEATSQATVAVNTAAAAADVNSVSTTSASAVTSAVQQGEGSTVSGPGQSSPAVASSSAANSTPAATSAPAATSNPAAPAQPVWKDGKYTAWGTCRHGDIQATVVIQGGRIVSADITDCQTRYSCDIIESLPPKVITRQKNKFDVIGGATESAYAYYGAVYWALDQASK